MFKNKVNTDSNYDSKLQKLKTNKTELTKTALKTDKKRKKKLIITKRNFKLKHNVTETNFRNVNKFDSPTCT